jgi:hypothetical protein
LKPLTGFTRLIKDGKQQTSRVVLLDLLLVIVWFVVICHFSRKRMIERESKESKVMVILDIFWYSTLLVRSELPLLVMQIVHNCTWIKHGSGPKMAYYHFNNFTRLKYC